ncbi:TolC family protein [Dinghuibacter silviterrae]|uniref:Outer membrane efflux protein n=1 Tax=Dinghuibacter silviterrae TaxID=1539049 RepID=A0A4V3GM35_9BACT|nr:TolC family protein [Dinghuibacter silviterrae]TDX01903.1 outer membrane efflux protein [Dinghuibacter silviterrae]
MRKTFFVQTLLLALCLSALAITTRAQNSGGKKIAGIDTTGVEQKLIRIALQRPSYDATYRAVRTANHQLSEARNSWLNLLSLSLNYNDLDFKHYSSTATAPTYVYPKYFFGLVIPIGYIFSRGSEIRIARENQAIAKDARLEAERTIVADVKSKYRTYLNYQNMLDVQNIIVNDEQATFLQAEKNFRDGKASIDGYNTASKAFNGAILQQLQYKLMADQVKVDLEHVLGMTLEEALVQP